MSSVSTGGRGARREPSKVPYYVVLVLLALIALGPLVVLAFNSLKTSAEIGENPLGPPLSPVFENFPNAWTQGNFATTLINSTILTTGTVVGVCLIAGTAAIEEAYRTGRGAIRMRAVVDVEEDRRGLRKALQKLLDESTRRENPWRDNENRVVRVMIYGSVAKGYRGGGFNAASVPAQFSTYGGDTVWTYELGGKASSADGRWLVSGAVYYNDYTDFIGQNALAIGPGGGLVSIDLNLGDVESYRVGQRLVGQPLQQLAHVFRRHVEVAGQRVGDRAGAVRA